jgi:hypothetical protein
LFFFFFFFFYGGGGGGGGGGWRGEENPNHLQQKKTITSEKFKTQKADSLNRNNAEMSLQLNRK